MTANSHTRSRGEAHDRRGEPSSCPYAIALQDDEDSFHSSFHRCPAFQQGSCPFKDAKSPDEIKAKLQQLPESHRKNAGSLSQLLQGMRQVHPASPKYQLDPSLLEGLSLVAIIADLVEDSESDDESETRVVVSSDMEDDHFVSTLAEVPRATPKKRLSESLKTGTATSHQAAEDVHFVRNFIQGKIDRDLYARLVGMLYHVYQALEECLDRHAAQYFELCHFPYELNRTEALKEDLDFWLGSVPPPSPATRDYVDRLYHVAKTNPLLLLAHAYTRYLGDLSGGKVLARVARNALNLDRGGPGLEFYDFDRVDSAKLFKDKYRRALDSLSLTPEQVQQVVVEANVAFCLNMRLFEELDVQANVPGARVRPLDDVFEMASKPVSEVSVSEECPFLKSKQKSVSRCPWPFIFAHDPAQGMKDWQTWLVMGLVLCYVWSNVQKLLVVD